MTINFYNHSCFKVQSGEFTIAFDPPSKESGLKTPRFQTDVILISHNHKDHNDAEVLTLKENNSHFIINTPGEYEIKGAVIKGVGSFHDAQEGKEAGLNTIFIVDLEDMKICHLGDYGETKLRTEVKEALGKINVLFAAIAGKFTDIKNIVSLINELEPAIVIPMHYDAAQKTNGNLKEFLNEFSEESIERLDKLTIKKKDIDEEKTRVVVLNYNH